MLVYILLVSSYILIFDFDIDFRRFFFEVDFDYSIWFVLLVSMREGFLVLSRFFWLFLFLIEDIGLKYRNKLELNLRC